MFKLKEMKVGSQNPTNKPGLSLIIILHSEIRPYFLTQDQKKKNFDSIW